MITMACPQCGERFDVSLTHDGALRRTGPPRTYCSRRCGNRAEHLRNGRERMLHRHYGLTLDARADLERAQQGRCAICRRSPDEVPAGRSGDGRLYVDHDHQTGVVRGLLCGPCNVALGMAGDSVEVLAAAITYLQEHARDYLATG